MCSNIMISDEHGALYVHISSMLGEPAFHARFVHYEQVPLSDPQDTKVKAAIVKRVSNGSQGILYDICSLERMAAVLAL